MVVKRSFFGIVAGVLVMGASLDGVGVEDLYHLDGHILKKWVGLHFLHGFVLNKTPNLLRNIYVSGSVSSPLLPLVRSLFWHIHDEEELFALRKSVFAVISPYWCGALIALARFCPEEFALEKALFYSSLIVPKKVELIDVSKLAYPQDCVVKTFETVVCLVGPTSEKVRCSKLWRKLHLLVAAMKGGGNGGGFYKKSFPLSVFLAFICDFSVDRRVLCDFIKGFAQVAAQCKKNVLTPYGREIFLSDFQTYNAFCSQKYPLDFYKQVKQDASLEERIIARIQSKHLFIPTLKNFGSRHFADCVEVCLLKMIGGLLFSDKTDAFDSLLFEKNVDSKKIEMFISDFSGYDANDASARLQWFRGLGNRQTATYAFLWDKIKVGLMPTESNMLMMINDLLGTDAKNWEELGGVLSTPTRVISFSSKPGKSKIFIRLAVEEKGLEKRLMRFLLINNNKSHAAILYSPTPKFLRGISTLLYGPVIGFLADPLEDVATSPFLKNVALMKKVKTLVKIPDVEAEV